MVDGFQLYLDEVNSDFAGAKVKLIVERSGQARPRRHQGKKLISQRQGSDVHRRRAALKRLCAGAGQHHPKRRLCRLHPGGRRSDATRRQQLSAAASAPAFGPASQAAHARRLACDQGYKKVVSVAPIMRSAYEAAGGSRKRFEDCGGKVIQKIWPAPAAGFRTLLSTVKADATRILADGRSRWRAISPSRLRAAASENHPRRQAPAYTSSPSPPPPHALMTKKSFGDFSRRLQYSAALRHRPTKPFVKKYRAKYGKVPSYSRRRKILDRAKMIHEVYKQTGGKWPGPEQFRQDDVGLQIDTPRGLVSFDDMRNPSRISTFKKVEKKQLFGYDKPALEYGGQDLSESQSI